AVAEVPVGQDELVEAEAGELPELVDHLLGGAGDDGPARYRILAVEIHHGVDRGPHGRRIAAGLLARLKQSLTPAGQVWDGPDVPLAGMPGGDALHPRPARA